MGYHHEMRFKEAVKLGEMRVFQDAPNRKQQRIIARQMFRNVTESEIDEMVEIARMGITYEQLQKALALPGGVDDPAKPAKEIAKDVKKRSDNLPESKS